MRSDMDSPTRTEERLSIKDARQLPRDHPGVWFCACGAGWIGEAAGYPDDLYGHAKFRAEDEPGAAHDPGLATFRPDRTTPSSPTTGGVAVAGCAVCPRRCRQTALAVKLREEG